MKRPLILTGIFCLILVFISTSMAFANSYELDSKEIRNALKNRQTSKAFTAWLIKKHGEQWLIDLFKFGMVSKEHKKIFNKIIEDEFRQFLKERYRGLQ